MKKTTLFLLIALFSLGNLLSANRDSSEAFQLAQDFFNKTAIKAGLKRAPSTTNSVQLVFSKTKKNALSTNYYYIFNQSNNQGFVIVSGDDCANDILAYSDENSFDPQDIPDNMRYWLSVYENEMDNLKTTDLQKNKADAPQPTRIISASENIPVSVSPLLGGIKWNQGSPYNNLCPIINNITNERAVTGCVATGMAQVMKYYQWPITGTGANSYTTSTKQIPLSLDFSQTTFDWANMTDTYNTNSSAAQKNAVATLMYNCGVSVNMNYAESSGASARAAGTALKNNFGYDSNIQYVDRDFYTRSEWKTMIKEELSAARPVLYAGDTGSSGHFFVCDGYDNNDFFHFNWGWGGTSNGYFRISALDPADQGIGGSTGGYNNSQSIIIGIQKPTNTSTSKYLISIGDTLTYPAPSVARNAKFTIIANYVYNYGINSFVGNIGLALFDNNNTYISEITSNTVNGLNGGYWYPTYTFSNIKIANGVANGNYKIYCVFKTAGSDWQIARSEVGTPNYINLTITSNFVYFSTPTNESPVLQLNSLTQNGDFYNNKIGRINASITNNGKEYNSFINIKLHSTTDNNISQLISSESINITAGETRELNFTDSIKLPAGNYYLSAWYSPKNDPNANMFQQLGNNTPVTVLETPTGDPILTLNSKISFPNATNVDKSLAVLTAQITNTGSLYDKKMIAFIFPKAGGTSLTYIGHQDVIIDQNETKNVTFQGAINLPFDDYIIAIRYQNNTNAWTGFTPTNFSQLNFTLVKDLTSISSIETINDFVVFPNPATNQITIQSINTIREYRIYNLLGEEIQHTKTSAANQHSINISNLKHGTYIVRIETEVGMTNLKFIKQ